MRDGSLGSGMVWFDPDKPITHFGTAPAEPDQHLLIDKDGKRIPKSGVVGLQKD